MVAPIPIKLFLPILTLPARLQPGAILEKSPISDSCSTTEPEFIIVEIPILTSAPIITPGQIREPSPILQLL